MRLSTKPFAETIAAVERWVLPGECILCRERVGRASDDPLICAVCQSRWRPIPHPRCVRCGQPSEPGRECRICAAWPVGFVAAESAVWLDESARGAVHALKYDGWWRVAASLVGVMARLTPLTPGAVLVPIPLGASRHRTRGYNQSAKLAHALATRVGLRVDEGNLIRVRETRSQTALTPDQRAANLREAFGLRRPVAQRVVLVDDVFTTGATLVAAAGALLARGATRVSAVTFARAELPLAGLSRLI